jgi:hypothetical protein
VDFAGRCSIHAPNLCHKRRSHFSTADSSLRAQYHNGTVKASQRGYRMVSEAGNSVRYGLVGALRRHGSSLVSAMAKATV